MRRLGNAFLFAILLAAVAKSVETSASPRLQVPMITDEADAVLAILERRARGETPGDADWQRLFSTEGYTRLQKRERSLGRAFEDSSFQSFVLSPELVRRAPALRATLAAWKTIDPNEAARRAFAYLPQDAVIRAKVYPVIKPKQNSFVFEPRTDPAIFLYLDPAVGSAKLENTIAHELHHIGVGSICKSDTTLSGNLRTAFDWMGGFAEGRAVLAAAGGPDVHPHAVSDSSERAVWNRDAANASRDLGLLEQFFLALIDGRFSEEQRNQEGMNFISTDDVPQGAFYTVGWLMASTVERQLGRERLVRSTCDPRSFLEDYNRAARMLESSRPLPLWSDALLGRLR